MKRRVSFASLLMAMCVLAAPARADTIRICVDEQSHMPFIDVAGNGVTGQLILQAAREVGIDMVFYAAPTTRCREEIRAGIANGFPTTPYTTALLPFMAYPMQQGKPDAARAVLLARAMVFRRQGSRADWDGKAFSGMALPALIPFGSVLLSDRLRQMRVPYDDKGKTLSLIFGKLLAGRGDVAIGAEYGGAAQLVDPRFAGKIEVLALPFSEESYYLAVSRTFYDANAARVEQLWDAIGRIRASPTYRAGYQKAIEAAERAPRE
jgi:polar amino acid transport system substrate-binding protein